MTALQRLSEEEILSQLVSTANWTRVENELEKTFLFHDFAQALAFIVQVGIVSEKFNHHPLLMNVYNKVTLRISTHSVQGITTLDFTWIHAIDQILSTT